MPRIFSMRGKLTVIDNQVTVNHPVFSYSSPDRTRAWKVTSAYVWPVDTDVVHADDGFMLCKGALATDTGKFNAPNLSDPTENRFFAWCQQTYNTRNGATDFVCPNGVPLGSMTFLVDPDTIITNDIFINIATRTDVDVNNSRDWGYLIILEEQKITPVQSLFQQLKGIGQDIAGT